MISRRRSLGFMSSALLAIGLGLAVIPRSPPPALAAEEPRTGKFEVYPDKAGEFRWRLLSSNGQVIATCGQGYKEKRDCLAGIESVKRIAADSKVSELTEAPAAGK